MTPVEFDAFAQHYRTLHAANIKMSGEEPEFFARYKIDDLAAMVRKDGRRVTRILDFGAGIGNSIPHWQALFPEAVVVCLDVSGNSLDVSRMRFPDARVSRVRMAGDRLPFEDGSFDLVFSACVFHHIDVSEHVAWFSELNRVAQVSAMLAIYEHNPLNPLTVSAVRSCPFDVNARLIGAGDLAGRIAAGGWSGPRTLYRLFFPRFLANLRPLEKFMTRIPFGAQYVIRAVKA